MDSLLKLVKIQFSILLLFILMGCETTPEIFGVPKPYWHTLTDEQKQQAIDGYYSQPPTYSALGYYPNKAYQHDSYDYLDDIHDELRIRDAERRAQEAERSARRAEERAKDAARSVQESQPDPVNNHDDEFYQPTKSCGHGVSCRGL